MELGSLYKIETIPIKGIHMIIIVDLMGDAETVVIKEAPDRDDAKYNLELIRSQTPRPQLQIIDISESNVKVPRFNVQPQSFDDSTKI